MEKYITVSRKFLCEAIKDRACENREEANLTGWNSKYVLHKIARLKRAGKQDILARLIDMGIYTPTRTEVSHYLSPMHRLSTCPEDEEMLQAREAGDSMEIPF
jgi:hypothetical protein